MALSMETLIIGLYNESNIDPSGNLAELVGKKCYILNEGRIAIIEGVNASSSLVRVKPESKKGQRSNETVDFSNCYIIKDDKQLLEDVENHLTKLLEEVEERLRFMSEKGVANFEEKAFQVDSIVRRLREASSDPVILEEIVRNIIN